MTIQITAIFSFPAAMTKQDREQFFSEIGPMFIEHGKADRFERQPHQPTPADEYAPVFAADDIARASFPDLDTVAAALASPAHDEFVGRWQSRFPYKVVWANHEPLI